jgi:hypothetical protein
MTLVTSHLNFDTDCPHLDFLACNAVLHPDGLAIVKELENLVKVHVSHQSVYWQYGYSLAWGNIRQSYGHITSI